MCVCVFEFLTGGLPVAPVSGGRLKKKKERTKKGRREEKKCCQSVLDEQGADGSGRGDAWRDGTMHYSGVVQTERDRWGKTRGEVPQHT